MLEFLKIPAKTRSIATMPAKNGFELQDRDIELLNYTFALRLATVDHLATLTGRSVRALWNRLLKLKGRRYVTSVARFMQKNVYAIGTEGVVALAEHGYAPDEIVGARLRHRELTDIGIRHSLFLADIHARLLTFSNEGMLRLVSWQEGSSLWDQVTLPDGSSVPIRPDALATIVSGGSKSPSSLFVEADRGTMAHSRMAQKVRGYLAYHQQQRFAARYPGMKTFSVVTITETRRRAQELEENLHSIIPTAKARRAYRFLPLEDVTPDVFTR
jgi:Replication-relaxation